jgi:hypothetical protein
MTMRKGILVRCALLLALGSTALLRAQFTQPTAEELKMTADPANPDASAIYLLREYRCDDVMHARSEHVRIKVLTEKAKDLATVNLGYWKGDTTINDVQARTIHADGTVVPLNMKPTDLLRAKAGEADLHEVVFNLPSVEVGSILEYYYQVHYGQYQMSSPVWEVQLKYPVRKLHYTFVPFPDVMSGTAAMTNRVMLNYRGEPMSDLLWYVNLPNGTKLTPDASGRFNLELADIPPLPDEQWMPPLESQRYQVIFYYAGGKSAEAYWNNEGSYWLKDMNRFAEPSGAIKAAAAGIVAPGDSEMDKAKKLYAAVQALDNTAFSRTKSKEELKNQGMKPAKRAEDTWTQKSGSPQDLALLYLALLRAAGLTAYPMKVVNRDRALFNEGYLNFFQLNDTVVILSTGGNEIFLDPGEKMCPFQMVHWKHSGAGGVRQMEKGAGIGVTPLLPYSANTVTRRGEITVAADGSITGRLQFLFSGQEALRWRQEALKADEDTLKHDFNNWLKTQVPSGVEAEFGKFTKLDEMDSDLSAFATVKGNPGSATGKRVLLPGSFFATAGMHVFIDQPNRTEPVDMHYAEQVKDGVLYHLPAGFSVESMPQTASVPWPKYAALQVKVTASGSDVSVAHTLARAFSFLGADEYPQLRDFYQKVAAADQQQLVVAAATPGAGN